MINWPEAMYFVRGPMFYAALVFFVLGMAYRLVSVIALGWGKDHVPAKNSKVGGSVVTFLKSLIVLPFFPRFADAGGRSSLVTYLAGGLFHLGLIVVVLLGTAHMLVWKSLLGFGWWTLPLPVVDWMAAIAIVAMMVLFVNRLVNPVLRLLSRPADFINLLMVFLPFITGFFLTHRLFARYEIGFTIHVLTINLLLIWIPLSRISHFMFYFISKARHGARFAQRGAQP